MADVPLDHDLKGVVSKSFEEARLLVEGTLKRPAAVNAETDYERFASPKVVKLVEILEQSAGELRASATASGEGELHEEEGRHMTALVFVQTKQTASALTHILTRVAELNPNLSFLRADFVVGGQGRRVVKLYYLLCTNKWS